MATRGATLRDQESPAGWHTFGSGFGEVYLINKALDVVSSDVGPQASRTPTRRSRVPIAHAEERRA